MELSVLRDELERIIARYERREAALLPVLWRIQETAGHIDGGTEAAVARLLDVPRTRVHEAVTFYDRLRDQPRGRHLLLVCESICCSLLGAGALLDHLRERLGIAPGETTSDGRFTLETVECLAHCDQAPALMVDGEVVAPVTVDVVDRILEEKA